MGTNEGGGNGRRMSQEQLKAAEKMFKKEKVYVNLPLALLAIVSGAMIGFGMDNSPNVAIVGTMLGSAGVSFADEYEFNEKAKRVYEKLFGVKAE